MTELKNSFNRIERIKGKIDQLDDISRVIEMLSEIIDNRKQRIEDITRQALQNNNRIVEFRKNEYYLGNIINDKNLVSMFNGVFIDYVSNDILEGIRETFFNKFQIKLKNRITKSKRAHCLKVGAYNITQNKVADIMQISLLNEGTCIINDNVLNLFSLFIAIEEKTNTPEYKSTLKKYIKEASKELSQENQKYDILPYCIMSYAQKLLKEMGWYNVDKQ